MSPGWHGSQRGIRHAPCRRIVAVAIALARQTLHTIRGDLVWAFVYNVTAVPLAALGLLNPLISGAAMAMSSAFVVWNSSRIGRGIRPPAPLRSGEADPVSPWAWS